MLRPNRLLNAAWTTARFGFPWRAVLAAGLLVSLAGCATDLFSYPPQVRGNRVDADVLAQLVVGTSTRQDVSAALGSPTAKATFDDNTWLYISEITKPVIGAFQGVEDQEVYAIAFDDKGVMTGVTKRSMKDSLPVDVVARTTPSPGTEASFMQQLLGNVGRFSPGVIGPQNEGAPGTATNPGNF